MLPPPRYHIRSLAVRALTEDLAAGDVTTESLFPEPVPARATILAHQPVVAAGIAVVREVFAAVDGGIRITRAVQDGTRVDEGRTIVIAEGDGRSLLMAERTALNFLQRLSGIATITRAFCEAVHGFRARIVETRKTTPGLRVLEKWAVRLGGGHNHRASLADGVLIKDNHLALLRGQGRSLADAVRAARDRAPHGLRLIIEASSRADVEEALAAGADTILLDNMSANQVIDAVGMIKRRAVVEVSGGVTLATARDLAAAGADYLSIGALTHSAPAVNLSMDIVALGRRHRGPAR
ncbi:carboxylating nicotinate-nucleotide diphosphorylase [Candidatus Nitrospira bockiana]